MERRSISMILEEGGELPFWASVIHEKPARPVASLASFCCLAKRRPFNCAEQRQRDKAAAKALHATLQRTSIQEDAESPDQLEPVAPQAELHQEVRQPSRTDTMHSSMWGSTLPSTA